MIVRSEEFDKRAKGIHLRHRAQTAADVARLHSKYQKPVFGPIKISEAVLLLKRAVDPTDKDLYQATQWDHICQVVAMMEAEAVTSEEMLVCGLVHDIGKVLLLTDEDPENVVCDNFPIGGYPDGVGLDNVIFNWNHDEFGYDRLKSHLPWHMAKLVRYHSLHPSSLRLLSDKDRWLYDSLLKPFRRYDKLSKSPTAIPKIDEDRYLSMLDRWFPDPVIL